MTIPILQNINVKSPYKRALNVVFKMMFGIYCNQDEIDDEFSF